MNLYLALSILMGVLSFGSMFFVFFAGFFFGKRAAGEKSARIITFVLIGVGLMLIFTIASISFAWHSGSGGSSSSVNSALADLEEHTAALEDDFKRLEASRSQPRLKALSSKFDVLGERSKKLSTQQDLD